MLVRAIESMNETDSGLSRARCRITGARRLRAQVERQHGQTGQTECGNNAAATGCDGLPIYETLPDGGRLAPVAGALQFAFASTRGVRGMASH